jgi:hypothetical protein
LNNLPGNPSKRASVNDVGHVFVSFGDFLIDKSGGGNDYPNRGFLVALVRAADRKAISPTAYTSAVRLKVKDWQQNAPANGGLD